MALPSRRILTYSDGTYSIENFSEMQFYRVPHDFERVRFGHDMRWRGNVPAYVNDLRGGIARIAYNEQGEPISGPAPEVYRLDPTHHTIIDCHWQRVWREINPELSDEKWATLLGNKLAWTNDTGFPGRRDCVNDSCSDCNFPRFDQPRVNGGALLTGIEIGDTLRITSLKPEDTHLSSFQIINTPGLWFWGTSVSPNKSLGMITRLGMDGQRHPVRVPLLTAEVVTLPLSHLHKLPKGHMPDALWLPGD
jgi:hypothetical protein